MLACLLIACAKGQPSDPAGVLRRPGETPERTTGCIDTPYIGGGDAHASATGIVCGRARSSDMGVVQGRVTQQLTGGLPGGAAEGLSVSLHVLGDQPPQLDALPPAHAQASTGVQGEFTLARGPGRVVIVVRAQPTGPILAARVLEGDETPASVNLSVPAP